MSWSLTIGYAFTCWAVAKGLEHDPTMDLTVRPLICIHAQVEIAGCDMMIRNNFNTRSAIALAANQ